MPGAVGISLALPGRPIAAIVGDGSAMYGIQGLWTAAHERLPITYVIANNRGYRIIKERLVSYAQDRHVHRHGHSRARHRFRGAGYVSWIESKRVTDPQDIAPALRAAFTSGEPNLIDVRVADGFGG